MTNTAPRPCRGSRAITNLISTCKSWSVGRASERGIYSRCGMLQYGSLKYITVWWFQACNWEVKSGGESFFFYVRSVQGGTWYLFEQILLVQPFDYPSHGLNHVGSSNESTINFGSSLFLKGIENTLCHLWTYNHQQYTKRSNWWKPKGWGGFQVSQRLVPYALMQTFIGPHPTSQKNSWWVVNQQLHCKYFVLYWCVNCAFSLIFQHFLRQWIGIVLNRLMTW